MQILGQLQAVAQELKAKVAPEAPKADQPIVSLEQPADTAEFSK